MDIIIAAILALTLDLLLGDPEWLIHPVVIMGRYIKSAEKRLGKVFPKTARGEYAAGMVLAISLPVLTFSITYGIIYLAGRCSPAAAFILQVFWGWQAIAVKGLISAGKDVAGALDKGDLDEARRFVARIVGRDTEGLDKEGIIKACVESLAENFSDGIAAPLFYFMAGGAPLALCYKAVNTMDSMVGYKNGKYLYFGRPAARLDDLFNYIPSRLSAATLIAAAGLSGFDAGNALRIWRRDRRKHDSPNSAQTESVVAGALGIELGGGSFYFGEYKDKPVIGDRMKAAKTDDIRCAIRMIFSGSLIFLSVFCALRAGIYFIF